MTLARNQLAAVRKHRSTLGDGEPELTARLQLLVRPADERLVLMAQDVQCSGCVHPHLAAAGYGRRLLARVARVVEPLDGTHLLRGQVELAARLPVRGGSDQ